MGRREIINGALLAVLGLGGTAIFTGLTTESAYTPLLVWGGLIAVAASIFGLAKMMFSAPAGELAGASGALVNAIPARDFLPPEITPDVLLDKVAGRTNVQIDAITRTYAGKWIRYEGRVRQVSAISPDIWLVHLEAEKTDARSVLAAFEGSDQAQLFALNKGDWITIEGAVDSLDMGLSLTKSELIHVGKHPKPTTPGPPRVPRKPRKPRAS